MTLPTSGSISSDQIMAELRVANPTRAFPLSLTDADVLALAGKSSPPISIPADLYGKSSYVDMIVTRVDDADSMASNAIGSTYIGHAAPSVTVSGGSGGYTYLWAITAGSGFTLTLSTSRICDVAHSIPAAGFNGTCTLSCAVTDNTSHTVTQTGILAVYAA